MMGIQYLKKWKSWLWRMQGIFALIALIGSLGIEALFMNVFFYPGNRIYAFNHFIMPMFPGFLMLLFIAIGSFIKWRLAVIINLVTAYSFIQGFIYAYSLNDGFAHYKYIDPLVNIANAANFLMILCGILLLLLYSYYSWQRIKALWFTHKI